VGEDESEGGCAWGSLEGRVSFVEDRQDGIGDKTITPIWRSRRHLWISSSTFVKPSVQLCRRPNTTRGRVENLLFGLG
jgi:hypothetical protein